MSTNNFLKKYSNKIRELNPSESAAGADWDLIEMRLEEQDKKRKRRYLLLFVLILLLVTILGKYVYDQYKNPIIKGEHIPVASSIQNYNAARHIQTNKAAIESSKDMNDEGKVPVYTSKGIEKVDLPSKIVVNKLIEQVLTISEKKDKYNVSLIDQSGIDVTGKGIDQKMLDSNFSNHIMLALQPSNGNVNIDEKETDRSAIITERTFSKSFLPLEILSLNQMNDFNSIQSSNSAQITFPQIKPKSLSQMKYFVKIDGGPITTIHSGAPEMMAGMLNFSTHTMSKEIGMQTGLSLQLVPNEKWKFGLGVNRSYLIYHASHTASLRLMDGICLNPDSPDPKEYAFSYNVTNGRSSSTINLRLSEENQGTPLDSTEVFNIEMGMHKETVSWAIPITAERVIYTKGDWSVFAKGGLNFGVSSYSNETITHFSESCANLCFNHGFSPSVLNQKSNQITTGIILGMSVEWLLSPRMRLVMNPEINVVMMMPNEYHNNHTKWGINLGGMYQIK
jgi:hypothetical protein